MSFQTLYNKSILFERTKNLNIFGNSFSSLTSLFCNFITSFSYFFKDLLILILYYEVF